MADSSAPSERIYAFNPAAEELRSVFQSITASSCPHQYNFHMHTRCSDGQLSPGQLMEQAIELQLQGLAITDHHTVRGYEEACSWLENWRWRHPSSWSSQRRRRLPQLWTGIEITSQLLDSKVHILGYGFSPGAAPIQPYLKGNSPTGSLAAAERVIRAIQAAGGIAVLAHPARYRRSAYDLVTAAAALAIDGVETYYAYDYPAEWRPTPGKTEAIEELATTHQLLRTCGTDSHGLTLTRRV